MNKNLIAILLLLFFVAIIPEAGAQKKDNELVFEKVELNAHTDPKLWANHIRRMSRIPDSISAAIPAGIYKATVQFIIDIHGNIGQVKLKNDPGYGLGKIALNTIRSYTTPWVPANQCGRNVNAYREETISFIVGE